MARAAIPAPAAAPPGPAKRPVAAAVGIVYRPVLTYAGRKEAIDSANISGIADVLSKSRLLIESSNESGLFD